VFEGKGRLQEYVGGYDDWLRQSAKLNVHKAKPVKMAPGEQGLKKDKLRREKQKLSYKETRELEGLPLKIEALEKEKRSLHETLNSPAFYVNRDADKIGRASEELRVLEKELEGAYGRWEELESLAEKFSGEQAR